MCVCVCIQRFKSFVALKGALRNNPGQARYCQHQACEIWKQNQKIKNHRWQGLNWSKLRKERKVGFEWISSSSSRDHKATPLPGASGAHAVKRAHAVKMQSPTGLQTCSSENLNLRDTEFCRYHSFLWFFFSQTTHVDISHHDTFSSQQWERHFQW